MNWSLRLGSVAGIAIYIHWTFLLLIGWVVFTNASGPGASTSAVVTEVVFVLAVFACVVLHELGHALTAKRFGIRTRDIILLPIGGVARLERMPDNPVQELWVAVAGPLVNVAIALVTLAVILGANLGSVVDPKVMEGQPIVRFMWVNVWLVVFNMIPAFPMDGGRVLRALLALRIDYARATRAAARVGQFIAIAFAVLGLYFGHPVLILIGVFVFLGAQAESQSAEMRGVIRGVPVRDAMMTDFRVLPDTASLHDASEQLLAGSQHDFPVVRGDEVVGILTRSDLMRALATGGDRPVSEVMNKACRPVDEREMLDGVFQKMQEANCPIVPVLSRGRLAGLVSLENIGELVMIRSALQSGRVTPIGARWARA